MASIDLASMSESLASIFKDEIHEQFNRSAVFPRLFGQDVVRTVAEEEEGDVVLPPTRPVPEIGWDVAFGRQMAKLAADVPGVLDVQVGNVRLDGDSIVVNMNVRPERAIEMLTLDLEIGAALVTHTVVE